MYAKGGILPGYDKSVPTQETMKPLRSSSIGGSQSQYNSINEVVQAYNDNKINYNEACRILENDFGQSGKDCRDILIIDNPGAKPDCGVGTIAQFNTGSDRWECIPDSNYDLDSDDDEEEEDDSSSFPGLTDNQRFLLIGLVVVGLFAKKVM